MTPEDYRAERDWAVAQLAQATKTLNTIAREYPHLIAELDALRARIAELESE